jgi:hypothetical protein
VKTRIGFLAMWQRILTALGLVLVLSLGGCKSGQAAGPFERKLVSGIKEKCQRKSPCIIRMKDVTTFSWDKMYSFIYASDRKELEEALGSKVSNFDEFSPKLVFMDKGKIVLLENQRYDVSQHVPDELVFDVPENQHYRVYGPDAAFRVTKVETSKVSYYKLDLVTSTGSNHTPLTEPPR